MPSKTKKNININKDKQTKKQIKKQIKKKNNQLFCLTYNVCWECIENSPVGSGRRLGKKCRLDKNNKTSCFKSVVKLIDSLPKLYQNTFDFIGLQEAAKWYDFIKDSKVLDKMNYLISKTGNEQHLTLYNPDKHDLLYAYAGHFLPGRPLHLLVFKDMVLVNLHYCNNGTDGSVNHGKCQDIKSMDFLQKDLDNVMGKLHHASVLNRDVKILHRVKLSNDEKIRILKSSRIIVMGDFNSHYLKRRSGTMVRYKPFSLVNKVVKAKNIPSCCYKTLDIFYNEPCDYVFDSKYKKENITEVPSNYDYTKIHSDHLPIVYLTK